MTQPKNKGAAASAQPAQGVASEAARSPEAGAAGADAEAPTTDLEHCADCGSEKVVYVTEDPAAEPKAYCKRHKPANVTDKMVEEQGRT